MLLQSAASFFLNDTATNGILNKPVQGLMILESDLKSRNVMNRSYRTTTSIQPQSDSGKYFKHFAWHLKSTMRGKYLNNYSDF